jgi:hypothetical protein
MTTTVVRPDGTMHDIDEAEGVWTHHCGSQLFHLDDDGGVTCAECDERLETLTWRQATLQ